MKDTAELLYIYHSHRLTVCPHCFALHVTVYWEFLGGPKKKKKSRISIHGSHFFFKLLNNVKFSFHAKWNNCWNWEKYKATCTCTELCEISNFSTSHNIRLSPKHPTERVDRKKYDHYIMIITSTTTHLASFLTL